jgi:phosphoserine phosphatase
MGLDKCNDYCIRQIKTQIKAKPKKSYEIKMVLFDMDGVLIDTISSWKYIHEYFNVSNNESVKAYIQGEIDDYEFIKRDVSLWSINNKPITKEKLTSIISSLPIMKGAKECIDHIKKMNIKTVIVSAGLDILANKIALELGIDYVYANGILTDDEGYLTGKGVVKVPLKHKDKTVKEISMVFSISTNNFLAVGNSCFDIPMLNSCGVGIAFNPDDECIIKNADYVINKKDLTYLIPVINDLMQSF